MSDQQQYLSRQGNDHRSLEGVATMYAMDLDGALVEPLSEEELR